MITTAILDETHRVDVLGIDGANAVILTKDGEDMEVSVDRLSAFDRVELDLSPLEW
jgi:hypothetical protein